MTIQIYPGDSYDTIMEKYRSVKPLGDFDKHERLTAPKVTCEQCTYWRRDKCHVKLKGWPTIGRKCFGFTYEPGTWKED